jgi:hypothetical protein
MSIPIQEFWKLAAESRLLSGEECQRRAGAFEKMKGAANQSNANTLAQWLVAEGALTAYQAKILLARRTGPFFYADYQIVERIDSGRFAGLFRAVHLPASNAGFGVQPGLGYEVCLSFLSGPALQDPHAMAQLMQLAAASANLAHPHLARVYQFVDLGTYKFVVLESLEGSTLEQRLEQSGPLPAGEACRLARQAALALAQMHQAGLVHGEVRPANLWLEPGGGLKLLHFPLSRDPFAPPTLATFGTPATPHLAKVADYQAPELASGSQWPDARSDVYSLGCTLYYMLTGRPPLLGSDLPTRLQQHLYALPLPANQINPQVPDPVAQVTAYLLAKNPAERYQQAAHVAEALAPYVDSATSPAAPAMPGRDAYEQWLQGKQVYIVPAVAPQMPQPAVFAATQPVAPAPQLAAAGGNLAAQPQRPVPVAGAAAPQPVFQPGASGPMTSSSPRGPNLVAERRARARSDGQNRAVIITCASILLVLLIGFIALMNNGDDGRQSAGNGNAGSSPSSSVPQSSQPVASVPAPSAPPTVHPTPVSTNPAATGNPVSPGPALPAESPAAESFTSLEADPLWDSPTAGPPLDLRYLPPGVRVYVALRPAEIWAHPQGQSLLAGLEELAGVRSLIEDRLRKQGGTSPDNIEQAIFAFGGSGQRALVSLVVRTRQPVNADQARQNWGNPEPSVVAGKTVYKASGATFFLPPEEQGRMLVMTEEPTVDWLAGTQEPYAPFKDLEPLRRTSDSHRHLTVLFVPSFFTSSGKSLFVGPAEKLKEPVQLFFSDEIGREYPAGLASLHLNDNLFLEVRAMGETIVAPPEVARQLRQRVGQLTSRCEEYLLSLNASPYSKKILQRLPRWTEQLDIYTRAGSSDRQAVLRAYLPAIAAPNLAFGTHLALLESPGGGAFVAVRPQAPQTAAEKLKMKISLAFPNNSLEKTMELVGEEIGVPITILGGDLQLDGITKNQAITNLEERDKPAFEVLKTVMMKANPEGKLIYTIKKEGDQEVIHITTRDAAAKRGDAIPPELQ